MARSSLQLYLDAIAIPQLLLREDRERKQHAFVGEEAFLRAENAGVKVSTYARSARAL